MSTWSRNASATMPLNTWDLVFDKEMSAKLADCGIFMLDAPTEMVPAARTTSAWIPI
jgi:spermidine/putrescine-binding protein